MEQRYTNRELAIAFNKMAIMRRYDMWTRRKAVRAIENYEGNIAESYERDGLEGLEIGGVGKVGIEILTLILGEGHEEAIRLTQVSTTERNQKKGRDGR